MTIKEYIKALEELNSNVWTGYIYDLYTGLSSKKLYIHVSEEQGYINHTVADGSLSPKELFVLIMTQTKFLQFTFFMGDQRVSHNTFRFKCLILKDNVSVPFEGDYRDLVKIGLENITEVKDLKVI